MIDQPWLTSLLLIGGVIGVALLAAGVYFMRTVADPTTTSLPLTRDQMPQDLREAIDNSDADFLAAGFRHVVDLKTRRRGVCCSARHYLTADNTAMAEISAHQAFGFRTGGIAYALTSLLDEGTVLQTVHHAEIPECFGEISDEARFILLPTGSTDPRVLLSRHEERLAELGDEDRRPVPIRPDFIRELNAYIYHLADWELHRQGTLPNPPPSPECGSTG